jgi:hypothetical protein
MVPYSGKRSRSRGGKKIGTREIGLAIAGMAAGSAATAGFCWAGLSPKWAGTITGGVGAIGAAASKGRNVRPLATGVALSGGGVAVAGWLVDMQANKTREEDKKKADAKQKQIDSGKTEVVDNVPANAKNANAAPYRQSGGADSITENMRAHIARAKAAAGYR